MPLVLSLLSACGSPPPTPALTPDHAYGAAAPASAQPLTPEEFQRRLDAGELTLTRVGDAVARRVASQGQQTQDLSTLGALTDQSAALHTLLSGQTDAQPTPDGDLLAQQTGTDGKLRPFLTLGTGTVAHGLVGTEQASRDPANALEVYRAVYRLLTPAQAASLPAPDSLGGKSITELRAALSSLDSAQGEVPDLDGVRSEVPGAFAVKGLQSQNVGISDGQQPAAGNGIDNSGVCAAPSPDGLLSRLRWPLKTFVSPIKSQGERGTCWAFSSVGALESRALVTDGTSADLSEQHFNNLRKLSSQSAYEGDWPRDALNDLAKRGSKLAPESAWTYNPSLSRLFSGFGGLVQNGVCTNYTGLCSETIHQNPLSCTVTNGVTFCGLESVVYGGGAAQPVAVSTLIWDNLHSQSPLPLSIIRTLLYNGTELILSFDTTREFLDLGKGGYLTALSGRSSYGGHAVQVTGFIPDSLAPFAPSVVGGTGGGWFVVKNSWGCTWGDAGYGYLPVSYVQAQGYELDALLMPSTRSAAFISVRDALSAVNPPPPVVTGVGVSGGPLDLYPGDSADFRALVSGSGVIDPNVTWTLGSAVGTLSRSRGTTVRYSAPASGVNVDQRVTLTATAISDPSQSGSINFILHPALPGSLKFSYVASDAGTFTSFAPNVPTPVLNRVTVTAALQAGTASIERLTLIRSGVLMQSLTLSPPLAAYQSGSATLTGDLTGLAPGPQALGLFAYDRSGNEVARTILAVAVQALQPVIGPPSPNPLKLSATVGGAASATISFANTGNAPLTADLTPAASWLTVLSTAPNPLAPGQSATVTLQAICPATPQTLTTTLLISDKNNPGPSQTVNVSLTCLPPPLPAISDPTPAVLNLRAAPGATANGSFTFTNTGAAPLSADIKPGSNGGWLSVLSNAPRPLAPGQTATATLQATCPATPQVLTTTLTLTANTSGVPEKTVNVTLTCQNASLPLIGDPVPAVLDLRGAPGTPASGSFTYTNTGSAPLVAQIVTDVVDSSVVKVISNTPSPLAPGQTATVTLTATCDAVSSGGSVPVTITANDSRVPDKRVTVNLTCPDHKPLAVRTYAVSTQNLPPFTSKTNPTVVLGKVTFYGDIQASDTADVETVKLINNGSVLSQSTVSVPAGSHSDYKIRLLDLDTTTLPNGLYTVTMRAVDSSGAFSDTAPFVIRVNNGVGPAPTSEIYTMNGVIVGPGQAPVTLKKSYYTYDVNLYGGNTGYSGALYACLGRAGGRILLGQIPFDSRFATYPVLARGVSPLEIGSNSDQIAVTDTSNGNYDTLFISGNSACDIGPGSNLPTTSVIRVIFTN
ncbi:C1 family peptidase [Deinococcus sp.]|uniref:C1 family peptidase n=1 Tax=Deinococcus sp. TaxID=47478 RepID=UPI003CC5841F